jgi:hypothetical protein
MPGWAIIKHEDGEDRMYTFRETKSTFYDSRLRPTELAKIKSAKSISRRSVSTTRPLDTEGSAPDLVDGLG